MILWIIIWVLLTIYGFSAIRIQVGYMQIIYRMLYTDYIATYGTSYRFNNIYAGLWINNNTRNIWVPECSGCVLPAVLGAWVPFCLGGSAGAWVWVCLGSACLTACLLGAWEQVEDFLEQQPPEHCNIDSAFLYGVIPGWSLYIDFLEQQFLGAC